MNRIKRQMLARCKRRILARLENSSSRDRGRAMINPQNVQYEMAARTRAIDCGGIGAVHAFVKHIGLDQLIDARLCLLKIHLPYHESDHVLNIAYNTLCGGRCLEDLELRRNDEVFLDALGTERIPDPTTAGDFCRRFTSGDIRLLMNVFDEVRLKIWQQQPAAFREEAIVDVDGSIVATTGECKEGMDLSYKGIWGYHPLLVTLANTGEVLRLVNRSGNRPSHEGAHREIDDVIALLERAGFQRLLIRGDTDFSQTQHLDRWSHIPGLRFVFGMACTGNLHFLADELPATAWKTLERPERYVVKTVPRGRRERVKQKVVVRRKFKDIQLDGEEVAEFTYCPVACQRSYRVIVVRKDLTVVNGQPKLYQDYRYFFYITNDSDTTAQDIVFTANDRGQQENIIEQLKNGTRSLHAPVDNLTSNWAYMVMAGLAWNLKAWMALSIPVSPRWREQHQAEQRDLLTMEFRKFVQVFIRIPCQIIKTGRQLIYRLLNWNPYLSTFRRLLTVLGH